MNVADQSPKVLNKHHLKEAQTVDAVYIGRGSKWGNPFVINQDGTRHEVIMKYREYIEADPVLLAAAKKELAGKSLLCFCSPAPCHGDVLLAIANPELEIKPTDEPLDSRVNRTRSLF